jgi:hypothetical protein
MEVVSEILSGAPVHDSPEWRFWIEDILRQHQRTLNELTMPVFDDLRIEPTARNTGAKAPSFENYNMGAAGGYYLYSFDDAVAGSQKEIFFTMQMPHGWLYDGHIDIHVHWIGNVADASPVAAPYWGLEYTWKKIGSIFGAGNTIYTDGFNYTSGTDYDLNVTAWKHYISKFSEIEATVAGGDGMSSIMICRLFRFSSDALDTYNQVGNKCGLLYVDAHHVLDARGSREEYVK